ncbi:RNA-guided endonuclease IscB [Polaromonas naphthalenivorans]|uniref:HNH endonuclease n=1 Tax=Polaromonas naphthalenivorans (strain CJ2) TaxID=365044 RepID=A1VVK5_POLNA|nr:RNA-guided endonuclease IscB [Polaromonas naphthalenivorans]ABM39683.1 HNH endonuclease [Polaromonas naphthalenivorans CJ2]
MAVFVLDRGGQPVMPCSEKRARLLLQSKRARVHRVMPFTIRLIDRSQTDCLLQPLRLKLDPGSRVTGLAVVREKPNTPGAKNAPAFEIAVINLFELVHRGRQISEALTARRQMRRRRRGNLRYRAPRGLNRGNKQKGWLAPSLQHRVDTTLAWVARLRRLAPITALSSELVRFDMQQLANPQIEGAEYQQGTLAGYEVREYLLEKWSRTCAYCDAQNTPLQIEHIEPRARGGSHRISNLCLACGPCNQKKAARTLQDFLKKDPARLARILAQAKKPLRDAAAVNATRWALAEALKATSLPLELASGGQTKFNRCTLGMPKTHALDAACVGRVDAIAGWQNHASATLTIKAMGRGSYQRTRLDGFGFPRGYLMREKSVHGFQTGDLVKAVVPKGKKAGTHVGRVAIRKTGSFNITTARGVVQGIGHKNCRVVQRNDGYGYFFNRAQHTGCEQAGPGATDALHPALYLPGLNPGVSRAS